MENNTFRIAQNVYCAIFRVVQEVHELLVLFLHGQFFFSVVEQIDGQTINVAADY